MKSNPIDPTASLVTIVDRSTGEQGLLISFEVSDDTGFESASFQFEVRDANDNPIDSVSAWANNWSSLSSGGNKQNGQHVVILEIPASAATGTYQLSSFSLRDQAGNEDYFSRNTGWSQAARSALGIDPDGLSFSVAGVSNGDGSDDIDAELPVISNISLSDRQIDRSSGERGTLLSFSATDTSGFTYANFGFELRDSNGQWQDSLYLNANAWSTLISGGSEQSGSHIGLIDIPPAQSPGLYELSYFNLGDKAGNSQHFQRNFNWQYDNSGNAIAAYSWSDEALAALGADPGTLSFSVSGEIQNDGDNDNTLPAISNINLNDTIIDLGSEETGALLSFVASDATGFDYASFTFSRVDETGQWLNPTLSVWANSWNSLVSGGTDEQGRHIAQLELPASAEAGAYELQSFSLADQAGNRRDFHRRSEWIYTDDTYILTHSWGVDASAALGTDPGNLQFSVASNSAPEQDTSLPLISNITLLEPATGDPTSQRIYSLGEAVRFEVELIDDGAGLIEEFSSGSGYSSPAWIGNITFRSPNGKQTVYHSLTSADRISGDANRGIYRIALALDERHQPGEWTLTDMYLEDTRGNTLSVERQYGSGDWDSPITELQRGQLAARLGVNPSDLSFTYNNPDYSGNLDDASDEQAPIITDFNLGLADTIDPKSWTATFSLDDQGTGVASGDLSGSGYGSNSWIGRLEFRSPDGQQTIYRSIESSDRVSGDSKNGTYSISLALNETHQPGEWTLTSLNIQDLNGNQFSVYRQSNSGGNEPVSTLQREQMAARLGLSAEALSFNYVNPTYGSGEADRTAPELIGFSLTANDPAAPESWTATLSLEDQGTGVASGVLSGSGYGSNSWIGSLEFRSPDGRQSIYSSIESSDRVSGDSRIGTYNIDLPLDETHQPGEWTLTYLYIQDASGNQLSVYRQSNNGDWSAPVTDLQREHMAARLGLAPEALSFNYSNPLYVAGASDTTPPALLSLTWLPGAATLPTPSAPDLVAASDSGPSDTDNITNVTLPTVEGTAPAGSLISGLVDGVLYPGSTNIAVADADGRWSYTLPAHDAITDDGIYTVTVIATDSEGNISEPSEPLVLNVDLTAPQFTSTTDAGTIDENSGADQVVYQAAATDQHAVTYRLKEEASPFRIDDISGDVTLTDDPDFESRPSYTFTVIASDLAGNEAEQSVVLGVNDLAETPAVTLSIADLSVQAGQIATVPIQLDQAQGLQSLDLTLNYDPSVFFTPAEGPLVSAGTLSTAGAFVINDTEPGRLSLSWSQPIPLDGGSGSVAMVRLQMNPAAIPGSSSLIDLETASINEGRIPSSLQDGAITVLPPSFQVLAVRQTPNGVALKLSGAPDMDAFNLYDGQDDAIDTPDLQLLNASGEAVALSAHWQESSSELHLLSADPLAAGTYTLNIDARADGLISAASAELLDGNGDGTGGDGFSLEFSHSLDGPTLSIADTARGSGQALGVNGTNVRDGLTGLPVLLSSAQALKAISGSLSFDQAVFNAAELARGADLPDDWSLNWDISSDPLTAATQLLYSATASTGSVTLSGNNLELFRFDAVVNASTESYGSTSLIEAEASATTADDTAVELDTDPGLVALAYSGDTTGSGTLSSLDASLVQRVVVELDSGFDAYDDVNPTLIGDTTGNGTLSSLDASRIQQQVVGLPVESFPQPTATANQLS